jgi:aryl-alcohol dehydrogenase-like predicted oxidoreductase
VEYRSLGRTGVMVSALALGCWQFGDRVSADESARLIDMAIDSGINFIDTADVYAGGRSEAILGKALRAGHSRDRVVLATKAYFSTDPSDPNMGGVSRRYLARACESSLRRLGVDHIDVYYLHRIDPRVPADETLRALDDLVRDGKILYFGTSTSSAWRFLEALFIARELGTHRYSVESPPYNLLDRRVERELIPMAQAHGVGLSAYMPLAGGILTGLYGRGETWPEGSRMADEGYRSQHGHWLDDRERVEAVVGLVRQLAHDKNCHPSELALAWVTQASGISSTIVGPETVEDLQGCLRSLGVVVTAEDRARIDQVIAPGTHVSSFYEWREGTDGLLGG